MNRLRATYTRLMTHPDGTPFLGDYYWPFILAAIAVMAWLGRWVNGGDENGTVSDTLWRIDILNASCLLRFDATFSRKP